MAGLIAVHVGAGYHAESKRKSYKAVCKSACEFASNLLRENATAVDAVSEAVAILEDSVLTNAGIGSNLTLDGTVECDAGIMDGETLNFGSVGAVYGIRNPIKVAHSVLKYQSNGVLCLGRIPPSTLVGKGAVQWAARHGFNCVDPSSLITPNSRETFSKYQPLVASSSSVDSTKQRNFQLDTVGAVCIDKSGNVASAVSSGGLLLKYPGRIGQAAAFGAGCWAFNNAGSQNNRNIGISVSGVGEYLVKTLFARECFNSLANVTDTITALPETFKTSLLNSPLLRNVAVKPAGALSITHFPEDSVSELSWAHTTHSFILGYMSVSDRRSHCVISEQAGNSKPGITIVASGKVVS